MAEPLQLKVLKAFRDHLTFINPTNESEGTGAAYDLDLRGKVWFNRNKFGATEVPALALLESPRPGGSLPVGENKYYRSDTWLLLLQGFVADSDKTGEAAYWLKAYTEERLARLVKIDRSSGKPSFPDEYFLGNLIDGLTIEQGVVRPPEENISPTAFFYIPLTVKLVTDSSAPFVA